VRPTTVRPEYTKTQNPTTQIPKYPNQDQQKDRKKRKTARKMPKHIPKSALEVIEKNLLKQAGMNPNRTPKGAYGDFEITRADFKRAKIGDNRIADPCGKEITNYIESMDKDGKVPVAAYLALNSCLEEYEKQKRQSNSGVKQWFQQFIRR
jgi:hypothetical protein